MKSNEICLLDMTNKTAADWWGEVERQLSDEQTKFVAWLADWDFLRAFGGLDLSGKEESEVERIMATLKAIEARMQGKAKPSSVLLGDFRAAKESTAKTVRFVEQNFFSAFLAV